MGLQPPGELAGRGRLPRPLQTDDHHDIGSTRGEEQPARGAAQHLDQFVVNDLDHLLARGESIEHLLAEGLGAHPFDEGPNNLEVDVRFEQREADLPKGKVKMLRGQPTLSAEIPDNLLQLVGECLKHVQILRCPPKGLDTGNHPFLCLALCLFR